jgi:imidazolonepropionase
MADLLVHGIGQLVTNDPAHGGRLGIVADGAVLIESGVVAWAGPEGLLSRPSGDVTEIDVSGAAVIPGFVDCHTHVAFAGDRADEFAMRLRGATYEEIMASGGGIASTVQATRAATDDELFAATAERTRRMLAAGTTTVEIKSGYGLDFTTERRLLEVITRIGAETPMEVIPTFLGAHVVPPEFADDREEYVRRVIGEMLPSCAPLARFCDVFCDRGAFTTGEARAILVAAAEHGLGARMHAEQLAVTGAATLAAELGAASADHLDHAGLGDLEALAAAGTVAVLLPGVSLSMRLPFPDAAAFRESGVTVAIATDANPGTSYVLSMQFVVALACLEMGMTPEEAVWSATRGGALALGLHQHGCLRAGSPGDLVVLDADSYVHLAYQPGANLARMVVKGGVPVLSEPGPTS